MKTDLRLTTSLESSIGGPESNALEFIYTFLLSEFKQNVYSRIVINFIGLDLEEFIVKERSNEIHINIRYTTKNSGIESKKEIKNIESLEMIHSALIKIAKYDGILNIEKIEAIRKKILDNNFSFNFLVKEFVRKKKSGLVVNLIVSPGISEFNYYVDIKQNGKSKCKMHLYCGMPVLFFGEDFFFYGKWKGEHELVITGKKNEVVIHVMIDQCKIEFENLTSYDKPPLFTLMRVDISENEREKARKDWEHSLPLHHAALIRQSLGNALN